VQLPIRGWINVNAPREMLGLGRVRVGLQVIGERNHWQKNDHQEGQRDELQSNRRKRGSSLGAHAGQPRPKKRYGNGNP
jgi:hypothetical protein